MIETNIMLNPYGFNAELISIGRILIANIGECEEKPLLTHFEAEYYNYFYMLGDGRWGIIYRHNRKEDIYALLTRVFSNKHNTHVPSENKVALDHYNSFTKRLNPLN